MQKFFICFLILCAFGCDSGNGKEYFIGNNSQVSNIAISLPLASERSVETGSVYSFDVAVANISGLGTLSASLETTQGTVDVSGLTVTFSTLTPIGSTNEYVATGTVSGAFTGDGIVKVTVSYSGPEGSDAGFFEVSVFTEEITLTFDRPNPTFVAVGDPSIITVTAIGNPTGGVFSFTGTNPNTAGVIFTMVDADLGIFTLENFAGLGSSSAQIRYALPSGSIFNTNFVVSVVSSIPGTVPFPATFSSSDTPAVFDETASFLSSIPVTSGSSAIVDIRVRVRVLHDFISRVRLVLTSPSGTQIELKGANGGSGDNLAIIFDDASPIDLSGYIGNDLPFITFQPDQDLSIFDGQDPNGTWTLEAIDIDPAVNGGSLEFWDIAFDGDTSVF